MKLMTFWRCAFGLILTAAPGFSQSNVFPAAGSAGVGTTSPTELLDVRGRVKSSSDIYSTGLGATRVGFLNPGGAAYPDTYFGLYYDNSNNIGVMYAASGGVAWRGLSFAPNGGNVGVGTLTPSAKLDVVGRGHFGTGTDNLANCANGFSVQDASGDVALGVGSATARQIGLTWYNSGTTGMGWLGTWGGGAPLGISSSTILFRNTHGDVMYLDGNGNLGIATDYPDAKLTVNGRIHAKEVVVDTSIVATTLKTKDVTIQPTAWSDDVFSTSYKLDSLASVEETIQQKGHLPGVPSASEVAKDGVSLSSMQAILLAKIEELTLHQIEQEKEIKTLRAKVATLQGAQMHTIH